MDRHLGTMLRELAKLHMDHGFLRPGKVPPLSGQLVRLAGDRRESRIDRRTSVRGLDNKYKRA